MARAFKTPALAAAAAVDDKKGEDIVLLNVAAVSPLTEYLLLVTALSAPHLESLEKAIKDALELKGLTCLHRARPKSDHWRVLDYGGLMAHIMTAEARAFYSLEKLFDRAKRVNLGKAAAHA